MDYDAIRKLTAEAKRHGQVDARGIGIAQVMQRQRRLVREHRLRLARVVVA